MVGCFFYCVTQNTGQVPKLVVEVCYSGFNRQLILVKQPSRKSVSGNYSSWPGDLRLGMENMAALISFAVKGAHSCNYASTARVAPMLAVCELIGKFGFMEFEQGRFNLTEERLELHALRVVIIPTGKGDKEMFPRLLLNSPAKYALFRHIFYLNDEELDVFLSVGPIKAANIPTTYIIYEG
ncbi:hypothetical protein Cgig2_010121 [Carnegiea gigantea]|uniref:Uncharacterized protein n=1 Tax=Carnegiea gigantea TaxID=171969 RepID=A0A9Q1JQK8_9CARY|nr:hypothetical protein Cgig2_010121 [Carnegiea gigantea]